MCVASVTLGLLYSLFALGLGLVLRASGEVNLAHGDTLTLATFVGVSAGAGAGSDLVAVVLAVAIAALIGLLAYLALYGPVLRSVRGGVGQFGFLPALALALVIRNVTQHIVPTGSRNVGPLFAGGQTNIFGDYLLPSAGWWVLALGLLAPLGLTIGLRRTRTGRRLRMVADDRVLASLSGIPVSRMLAVCYTLAGATGGLAGALFASFFGQLSVSFGFQATIKGFVVAILGGANWSKGALIGGLALGTFESFIAAYVTTTYRDAASFVVLIAVLLLTPRGLLARESLRTT